MNLQGKRILLGVTGSIAAYKAVELLRLLTKRGAEVQVVMTEAATKFVTPLTFETLTRQPVLLDMWSLAYSHRIGHIEATQRADLCVVAPGTAQHVSPEYPPRAVPTSRSGRRGTRSFISNSTARRSNSA